MQSQFILLFLRGEVPDWLSYSSPILKGWAGLSLSPADAAVLPSLFRMAVILFLSVLLFKQPDVVFSIQVQFLRLYYVRLVGYGESSVSKNE